MTYLLIKLIHIISATIMFGTGIGSAFSLFSAYKRSNANTVKDVLKLVILADNIFTTPAVLLQLITGIWLSSLLGLLSSKWFIVVIICSVLVFALWVRAVYLQIKMKRLLDQYNCLTEAFHKNMKEWFYLGIPAFAGTLFLFYLMVFKPVF